MIHIERMKVTLKGKQHKQAFLNVYRALQQPGHDYLLTCLVNHRLPEAHVKTKNGDSHNQLMTAEHKRLDKHSSHRLRGKKKPSGNSGFPAKHKHCIQRKKTIFWKEIRENVTLLQSATNHLVPHKAAPYTWKNQCLDVQLYEENTNECHNVTRWQKRSA